jgi:hypothetical protein
MTLHDVLHSRPAAWGVVLAAGLAYPLIALAGGAPRFPSVQDCVHPATRDAEVMLVYGYFDSVVRAGELRDRLRGLGYEHAEVQGDGGCGRVRVVVRGYPDLAGADDAVAEAGRVGLHPTVEADAAS